MSTPSDSQRELLRLIEQVLEDCASMGDQEHLEAMLSASDEARAAYVRYLDLHVSLQQHQFAHRAQPDGIGEAAGADSVEPLRPAHGLSRWSRVRRFAQRPSVVSLAMATIFVVTALAILNAVSGPVWRAMVRGTPPANVTLTASSHCRFVAPRVDAAGQPVFALAEGVAQFTYRDGVRAVISAPAYFEPDRTGAALLQHGRAYFRVPQRAVGYAIDTPLARIVDLGTEFALDVADDGSTEVHVAVGRVRLEPLPGAPTWPAVELSAGQSLRLGRQGLSVERLPPRNCIADFATVVPQHSTGTPGAVIHDRSLARGANSIDPAGAQQITARHVGGNAAAEELWSQAGFGVVQDWDGFVACGRDYRSTNVLTFSDGRPHVEFSVAKVHGESFTDNYGAAVRSAQYATSGDSALRTSFRRGKVTATHALSIAFGTLVGDEFIYDRAVPAACFTLNNINGGSNSVNDTTRYSVSFQSVAGQTLYRSPWVDVNSPKAGDGDELRRPNVYFAHQVPATAPRSAWIARIVITEQRRGAADSGNVIGFDDFGFIAPPAAAGSSNEL